MLHMVTFGMTPLDEGSARRRCFFLYDTAFTKDKHTCIRRDSNTQSQLASGRRPKRGQLGFDLCCLVFEYRRKGARKGYRDWMLDVNRNAVGSNP
jgi:hypothetical protein